MNKYQVEEILSRVSFAPSCVDMGWTWEVQRLKGEFPGVTPNTTIVGTFGYLIRTTFRRPDRDTGVVETGYGRWWYVPEDVTESGVVKTAFAAAKLILEHELMEAFRYEGERLFDPHHEVKDLKVVAQLNRIAGAA